MKFIDILWELFTLLFQGCIAGLIVLFFTQKLKKYNEKSLSKKHALLVCIEIKYHLSIYNEILTESKLSYCNTSTPLILDNWKDSKQFLTIMPLEKFEIIAKYYQTVTDINSLLVTVNSNSLISITTIIYEMKLHAEIAYETLENFYKN